MKQKGFKDYLQDDPSLAEKYTYDEFYNQKKATPIDEDISIEEAYASFCSIRDEVKNS